MVARNQAFSFTGVQGFLEGIFADDLRAKRILSLAGATAGVLQTGCLAVGLIGRGLALARGHLTKHATKHVDRPLSNGGVEFETLFEPWVRFVTGQRRASSSPWTGPNSIPTARQRS